jgi:hypothetical protein
MSQNGKRRDKHRLGEAAPREVTTYVMYVGKIQQLLVDHICQNEEKQENDEKDELFHQLSSLPAGRDLGKVLWCDIAKRRQQQ